MNKKSCMLYISCFALKEMKYSCGIFTVFVFGYLPATMFFFLLLSRFINCFSGKALANFFVTKCSILDLAEVLNPPQHAPIWIPCTNNFTPVPDEK